MSWLCFEMKVINSLVKFHHKDECESGVPAWTVNAVFSSRTPLEAQEDRSPFLLTEKFSFSSSLYIDLSDGLIGLPCFTENARPTAEPLWYGSMPIMTAFIFLRGVRYSALNTWLGGGYIVCDSDCRVSEMCWMMCWFLEKNFL